MSFELSAHAPYLLYVTLFSGGTFMILSSRSFLRAIIGLFLIQSSVVLFFILLSVQEGGSVPVVGPDSASRSHNPLPHALMLTAIVVGVATLGVAMALLQRLQSERRTVDDSGEEASRP